MCIPGSNKRAYHKEARRRYKGAYGPIFICATCLTKDNIEIHHINRDHTNNLLTNLVALCKECHKAEHTRGPFYE